MNLFFLSGLGAAGFAAIAVPLILHWLNRKPKYRVEFPALTFLLRSESRAHIFGSWRKRIILLLRVLGIAALSFAFCRPYLASLNEQPERSTLLLWDDSFSMVVEPEFSRLKNEFEKEIGKCSPEHPMTVGLIRERSVVWSGPFTGNAQELLAFFRNEAGNAGSSSFGRLAAEVDSKQSVLSPPVREVVLFTDRQKLPWEHLRRDSRFRHATGFRLVRSAQRQVENVFFGKAGVAFEGDDIRLNLVLRSNSTRTLQGEILLPGIREKLTLEPGAERKLTFRLPVQAGVAEIKVDDDIKMDNRLFWSCNPAREVTLSPTPGEGSVNYPALAVGVEKPSMRIPEEGAGKLWIEQDVASLIPEKQRQLTQFLDSGGTLALTLDGSPRAAAFLNNWQVEVSPSRALHKKVRRFGAFNFDHEVVMKLFGAGGAGAPEVLFFRSFNFDAPPEAEIIARYDDNSPAIAEIPAGGGRIWLFGFGFDRRATNWAGHYTFPTFWRILEAYAAGSGNRVLNMPLGASAAVGSKVEYDGGGGFQELEHGNFIRFDRPGNYRIDGKLISVNLPAAESVYEVDSQERTFIAGREMPDAGAVPADSRRELAACLIILALFCFLGEFLLANRTAL